MIKADVTCPGCGAGFRRIELSSLQGGIGEYRCPACNQVLEVFGGDSLVACRLTVQPAPHDKTKRRPEPYVAPPSIAALEDSYSA
jgi:predicted Zn finger-like uncharacterized protein